MGCGVALLGDPTIPLCGFGIVLRYTLACFMHVPEDGLRFRVALLGGAKNRIQTLRPLGSGNSDAGIERGGYEYAGHKYPNNKFLNAIHRVVRAVIDVALRRE